MINQEPPPPRYVLQVTTGKWHRQSQPTQRAVTSAGGLQTTLDYFLHKAMYGPPPSASRSREKSSPAVATFADSNTFEERLEKLRIGSSLARGVTCELNPLVGLLGGVPVYELYDALAQCKSVEWEVSDNDDSSHSAIQLSIDELYAVCTRLVSPMVSREYVEQMFKALPGYHAASDSVTFVAFFSFMVSHALHPQLDRNVRAIFKAFDPDGTGLISPATLTPTVFAAWAEIGLFGKVRSSWEKVAAVLERNGPVDLRVAGGRVMLTTEATCAVFCTSRVLYSAMTSLDMEGSRLQIAAENV